MPKSEIWRYFKIIFLLFNYFHNSRCKFRYFVYTVHILFSILCKKFFRITFQIKSETILTYSIFNVLRLVPLSNEWIFSLAHASISVLQSNVSVCIFSHLLRLMSITIENFMLKRIWKFTTYSYVITYDIKYNLNQK